MKKYLAVVFCLFYVSLQSQSIRFYEGELDDILAIAQRENKSVFVDAYAPWCIPCKKMDIIFRDKEVGKIFNDNFINLKLDMDLPSSQSAKLKYEIIFLPTLMVLDPQGQVRYKVDKVMSKEELITIANLTADPNMYFESEATKISSSPVASENKINPTPSPETEKRVLITNRTENVSSQDISSQGNEKILFVLGGKNGDVPPEILYKEAYFRMELMDGSQYKSAKKYLDSQTDWSTEKNIRFIFDFLYDTRNSLFEYFISNEDKFLNYYSQEQIDISKEVLIYTRLNQGFPRPDLEEVIELFSYLYEDDYEAKAQKYYLSQRQ